MSNGLFITPLGTRRPLNPDGASAREARKLEKRGYRREAGALRLAGAQQRMATADESPINSAGRYAEKGLRDQFANRFNSARYKSIMGGASGVQGAQTKYSPGQPGAANAPVATPPTGAAIPLNNPPANSPAIATGPAPVIPNPESRTATPSPAPATPVAGSGFGASPQPAVAPNVFVAKPAGPNDAKQKFMDDVLARAAGTDKTRGQVAEELNKERYAAGMPAFKLGKEDFVAAQSRYGRFAGVDPVAKAEHQQRVATNLARLDAQSEAPTPAELESRKAAAEQSAVDIFGILPAAPPVSPNPPVSLAGKIGAPGKPVGEPAEDQWGTRLSTDLQRLKTGNQTVAAGAVIAGVKGAAKLGDAATRAARWAKKVADKTYNYASR